MHRIIRTLVITAALIAFHCVADAQTCTTNGIMANGKYTVCTTCCPTPGSCITICS
jgi:hypothetical protein